MSVVADPKPRGHAIEFRINAEDVGRGFLPAPGRVTAFNPPSGPGIRLDSGVETGSLVVGEFDSLIAKLVVTGTTREQAVARARRALAEFTIEGVPTTLPFHRAVVEHPDFVNGETLDVYTGWIETELSSSFAMQPRPEPVEVALVRGHMEIDGRRVQIGLPPALLSLLGGLPVHTLGEATSPETDTTELRSPLAGILRSWKVKDGVTVSRGDPLGVLEAMKMETEIRAHLAGTIRLVATEGSDVASGAILARIES